MSNAYPNLKLWFQKRQCRLNDGISHWLNVVILDCGGPTFFQLPDHPQGRGNIGRDNFLFGTPAEDLFNDPDVHVDRVPSLLVVNPSLP